MVQPVCLMRTPPRFVLSRLSRDLYISFLDQAKGRGLSFVQFRDFLSAWALPEPYIVTTLTSRRITPWKWRSSSTQPG